jgi:hypothetical protein
VRIYFVAFEVLSSVAMKSDIFWRITFTRLYSIISQKDNIIKNLLSFLSSCKFSEDGQQLFMILETKSFQIYNIHDAMVELLVEEDTILLSALLESIEIGK